MNTMEISLTSLALCFLTSACVAPATDSANVDDPTNPELQRFELLYERPRTVEPSQIDRGAVGTLTEVNTTFAVAMYHGLKWGDTTLLTAIWLFKKNPHGQQ